jgi:hypothetical protein
MIFFLFFKNYFWDQRIKTIQNILKKLIFNKKINKFWGNAVCTAFPNALLKPVWYCGGGCFSKYFSFEIHQNNIFFIFLKFIFENNSLKQCKNIKKINLKKILKSLFHIKNKPALIIKEALNSAARIKLVISACTLFFLLVQLQTQKWCRCRWAQFKEVFYIVV